MFINIINYDILILVYFFVGGSVMRYFEKISIDEFSKTVDKNLYSNIILPRRLTEKSAGYDFFALDDYKLLPGESLVIPTGVKVYLEDGEFLGLYVRSSMGFKYNIRLCNQVGIIDGDYYNNADNEGHIFVKLQNEGNGSYIINKGDKFCQGIIQKYYVIDNDTTIEKRKSGIGSTGR